MADDEKMSFELLSDGELTEIMRDEIEYSEETRHMAFVELARRGGQDARDGG